MHSNWVGKPLVPLAYLITFFLSMFILLPGALAQQELPLQYRVKFVCGLETGRVVSPGNYFTAINVHNPNKGPSELRRSLDRLTGGEVSWPYRIPSGCGDIRSR